MDYQAAYFEKHPNSRFALLADNVKHPFNEYLSITVQFGLIGLLILLSSFTLATEKHHQEKGISPY